ncbi:MAG: diguanylate cyclase [Anaerolineales bacterium]|nr:diguanylate cyclase [Anaerolineales bacterium]MDW8448357.1 diguanylate cyclase [Anaerolineales bacterium]
MTVELRTFYLLFLFSSTGVVLLLSLLTWQRLAYLGRMGVYFLLCLLFVSIYNFGYAMELLQSSLDGMMFWLRFEHWGIQWLGPTWLLFVLALSGNERWITLARGTVLYGIAAFFLATTQTLGGSNLFHQNPRLNTGGDFPTFTYDRTWVTYLALSYYSLCVFLTLFLFTRTFLRLPSPFHAQVVLFWIVSLLPWLGGGLYVLGVTPHSIDPTPLTLTVSLLLFTLGIFRFGTLDLIPLARDVIFEGMSEAALVLDHKNRVLDFNLRLKAIVKEATPGIIGRPVQEVLQDHPALVEMIEKDLAGSVEFSVTDENRLFTYEAKQSPLYKIGQSQSVGKILILHDITPLKELVRKLEVLATTDSLTQLYNRRYFRELALLEFSRAERYGEELSLMIFDLDHFKLVNDRYGHGAGDAALVQVAQLCRRLTRQSDILARVGGEEFAALLPETSLQAAIQVAERLRVAFEQNPIEYEGKRFFVTASFGVSHRCLPERGDLEQLFSAADRALFQAKEAGRNRVWAEGILQGKEEKL